MLDDHYYPADWGLLPQLSQIYGFAIPSYSFFVLLGLVIGIFIYFYNSDKDKAFNENAMIIFASALIFGIIGAKIPIWIANYKLIFSNPHDLSLILSGRTIMGGLIGGTLGVLLVKKILKIKIRIGNQIAPAVAIGVAIGRFGCLLRGCCYGIATRLPWGVDFGDGILRHPTQAYEIIFNLIMFIYLSNKQKSEQEPGRLFAVYLNSYFIFRFFLEFIRVEANYIYGLSTYQWVCVIGVIYINRKLLKIKLLKGKMT